jgi:hypothetical protein
MWLLASHEISELNLSHKIILLIIEVKMQVCLQTHLLRVISPLKKAAHFITLSIYSLNNWKIGTVQLMDFILIGAVKNLKK